MSTPFQILFNDKNQVDDIETTNRFYKKRDISQIKQSEWLYEIFKNSMNAKIKSLGIVVAIFVTISIFYYETVIETVHYKRPVLNELWVIHHDVAHSHDEREIISLIERADFLFESI